MRIKHKVVDEVADYYGVSSRSILAWEKKQNESGSLKTKPRSGRPIVATPRVKLKICDSLNSNGGQSVRAATYDLKSQRVMSASGKDYETSYRGKKRRSPSKSLVHQVKKQCAQYSIRIRPSLTKENCEVRHKFAVEELALTDEQRNDNVVAIDEAWVTLAKQGTGVVCVHPDNPDATLHKKKRPMRQVRNKNHPPKIMVIAVIARPEMLNKATACASEPAAFSSEKSGKVAIMRCVEEAQYKRRVYDKETGELKADIGDTKVVSVTMDGERYANFMTRQGGIFDRIRAYFGPNVHVRLQEDGAPGHGYNNKAGRKPTAPHEQMAAVGIERNIKIFKQPHNSPELNPLDLGIWYSLQSKVKHMVVQQSHRGDDAFTESQIWTAFKEAWKQLPSRTIWNRWMVKDEILKELAQNNGGPIAMEPHSGVRARWCAGGDLEDL